MAAKLKISAEEKHYIKKNLSLSKKNNELQRKLNSMTEAIIKLSWEAEELKSWNKKLESENEILIGANKMSKDDLQLLLERKKNEKKLELLLGFARNI